MKRLTMFLLALFAVTYSWSQECTTIWPYIYPDFSDGTLYMVDDKKFEAKFNVHVQEGRLHYLDNGIIKEAKTSEIVSVKIGEDLYMNVEGKVMKVIGSKEKGFIATLILGDFDKLFNSSGAYGASSVRSAVTKLSSLEIGGKTSFNHMVLIQKKDSGISLPLKYKYYIVTKGKVFLASKKQIKWQLNEREAAEFKRFLKNNKIKWTNPQTLAVLLDFFNR